jgi:methyltransferase (TIGR00027 family)
VRVGSASQTAEYVALFRAIETARPEDERLFSDPLAAAFLTGRLKRAALAARMPLGGDAVSRYIDTRWPGPRLSAVVRTRVIDDAVREALGAGCAQLVLLGAGYDTRPYRLPEAAGVDAFEVDHPATQAIKREVLERELPAIPEAVRFVAVDFERDSLADALDAAGLRRDVKTCVVWEGVFSYLTIEAIDATLGWCVGACPPGSRLILTYLDQQAIEKRGERSAWIAAVEDAGEPFITGLDPSDAPRFFAERGLELLSDESTRESAQRLLPRNADGMLGFYRVAELEVSSRQPPEA